MKKYILSTILVILSLSSNAQKDPFDVVQSAFLLGQGKIDGAKVEFDKLVAKNPSLLTTQNGYLWKCRILCELISQPEAITKTPYLIDEAHNLFFNYQKLDTDLKTLTSSQISSLGLRVFDVLYAANFTRGRAFYQEKNYDSAYYYYDRACEFSRLAMRLDLRKNNGALDTNAVLMAGYSAQNAKKIPQAIKYYSFAIDNGFGGAPDEVDVFKYNLYGYIEAKDKANFDKYFAISQTKYPKENWEDYKLDFMEKNTTFEEKVAIYDKEDAAGTLTYNAYMTYGNMFYNLPQEIKEVVSKDQAKKDFYHNKARDCFKKAFNKNNTEGLAAYNVGVLIYNEYGSADDKYRDGLKTLQDFNTNKVVEKDPKKKIAAEAAHKAKVEEFKKINGQNEIALNDLADGGIEWYEKAFNLLKDKAEKTKQEKQSLKSLVNNLINMYEFKRNRVRGKDVKAFDAFEAKYKFYDDLYSKL